MADRTPGHSRRTRTAERAGDAGEWGGLWGGWDDEFPSMQADLLVAEGGLAEVAAAAEALAATMTPDTPGGRRLQRATAQFRRDARAARKAMRRLRAAVEAVNEARPGGDAR